MLKANKSRNWCFTLNNYTPEEIPTELPAKLRYIAFSEEVGESGTPHLQGFCCLQYATVLGTMKKMIPRAHFEIMRGSIHQNENYCSKEGELIEFGDKPASKIQQGLNEKARWRNIAKMAIKGEWDELLEEEPHVSCTHSAKLERLQVKFQQIPKWNDDLENYWIHGPPGTGKSFQIRQWCLDQNPSLHLFDKDQSKWWDTYKHEEYVLIDDLDDDWSGKRQLKRWSDRYEFKAQVKNSTLGSIRPRVIVVTSNYSIDEVFNPETEKMLNGAIRRRFTEVHMQAKYVHGISPVQPFTSTDPIPEDQLKIMMANAESAKLARKSKAKAVPESSRINKRKFGPDLHPIDQYRQDHPAKSKKTL